MLTLIEYLLFVSCLFILAGSIFLTFKLRFIQIRALLPLLRSLKSSFAKKSEATPFTVSPQKALFTAMSTTLGISTIVAPVIAMHLGGPGALLGFLLTSFFGSAATFSEVSLSVQHRKKLPSGVIMGGPMQYLKTIFSPKVATWYAVCCLILMSAWSGAQANQLAAILDSPLLGSYRIPVLVSGSLIALFIFCILIGGIKRVSALSAKLVPLMFGIYLTATLWIIFSNLDQFWDICQLIVRSAYSPYAMISGTAVGGIVSALRWGVFKGLQANEAGIGTQAIPHSLADTQDPVAQGSLAMLSTYTAGIMAFLSGCVSLMTNTWQSTDLPLGISMVAASYEIYFSTFGIAIIAFSTFLFAFGTIIGNSFNGGQCFSYLTNNRGLTLYFAAAALMTFLGAISDVKTFWSLIDLVLAAMSIPHMAALSWHALKQKSYKEEIKAF